MEPMNENDLFAPTRSFEVAESVIGRVDEFVAPGGEVLASENDAIAIASVFIEPLWPFAVVRVGIRDFRGMIECVGGHCSSVAITLAVDPMDK